MKLIDIIKEKLRPPTPLELIAAELARAHVAKLDAESAVDWGIANVEYNKNRITRLNERISEYKKEGQNEIKFMETSARNGDTHLAFGIKDEQS